MTWLTFCKAAIALTFGTFTLVFLCFDAHLVYVEGNKLLEGSKPTLGLNNTFKAKAKTLIANINSLRSDWQKELNSMHNFYTFKNTKS